MLVETLSRRTVTGAVLLAVVVGGGPCLADVAQQQIAFASFRDGNWEIYSMLGSGGAQTRLTDNGAVDWAPQWSPYGSTIAFLSDRDGNVEIYSMRADGSELTNLSRNAATDRDPRWSPDGSQIVFLRGATEETMDVWVMDADGGNQLQLTRTASRNLDPRWSPDGEWIAFIAAVADRMQIFKVRPNGYSLAQLTHDGGLDPTWAPNGKWIAYMGEVEGDGEICKMDLEGRNKTRLTHAAGLDRSPRWSPDALQIAFTSERDGNSEIYAMDRYGAGTRGVSQNGAADAYPHLSPPSAPPPPQPTPVAREGVICFQRTTQSENVSEIFLMNPDGSNLRACQRRVAPVIVEDPAFNRDASQIAYVEHDFTRRRTVDSALFYCPRACTGEVLVIKMLDALFDDPMWHPDGSRILFRYRPSADADFRAATYAWIGIDGTGLQPLAIDGYQAALSPDGQSLAVVRVPNMREYRAHIWLTDQWGNNPRQLTMTGPDEPAADHGPTWSPDGTTIAFFRSKDPHLGEDLCLVPVTGGQPRSVWTADLPELRSVRDTHLVWSPDGRELLFAGALEDNYSLYAITLGPPPHRLRRLTDAAGLDWQSDWR